MARRGLGGETAAKLQYAFGRSLFTREQALSHGISSQQLRAAVRQGSVDRLRHGIYSVPDDRTSGQSGHDPRPLDPSSSEGEHRHGAESHYAVRQSASLTESRAACAAHPGTAVSHEAAAVARDLPLPPSSRIEPVITGSRVRPGRRNGVRYVRAVLPDHHVADDLGYSATTLERTAVDVAREHAMPGSLATMDAALRQLIAVESAGLMDLRDAVRDLELRGLARSKVAEVLAECGQVRGVRNARECVDVADPAAESPLESMSRGVLLNAGIPRPDCGVPVSGSDGRLYWADMLWRDTCTIGECDGVLKYTDPSDLYREKLRQEALEEAGWRVVRWGYGELMREPGRIVDRILRAFARTR